MRCFVVRKREVDMLVGDEVEGYGGVGIFKSAEMACGEISGVVMLG